MRCGQVQTKGDGVEGNLLALLAIGFSLKLKYKYDES